MTELLRAARNLAFPQVPYRGAPGGYLLRGAVLLLFVGLVGWAACNGFR